MNREDRVALAKQAKVELERELPELAALREQLVAAGMMEPGFSAIVSIKTPTFTYNKLDHDPQYFAKQHAKAPYLTKEINHAIQTREAGQTGPTIRVPNSRGGDRRR